MADDFSGFLGAVKSIQSLLFKDEPAENKSTDPEISQTLPKFEDHIKANFIEFAGDFVCSSGNIDFENLGKGGDFKKAAFNDVNPTVKKALDLLVLQVFK